MTDLLEFSVAQFHDFYKQSMSSLQNLFPGYRLHSMVFIKVVNRNRYFLAFPFSKSCFNQNDWTFFPPLSFTVHKIYGIKWCYKLLLLPTSSWPGGSSWLDQRMQLLLSHLQVQASAKPNAYSPGTSEIKPPLGLVTEKEGTQSQT